MKTECSEQSMNSSRIELLWLVWDQSRSKYYLRTKFQDGIDKPQKCQNVCYHPTHQQQRDTCDRVAMLQLEICKFLAGDLVS
jgi:hypothetical protein